MWQKEKKVIRSDFREQWKRNELTCLPFQSSKSFFGYNFSTCCYPIILSYDAKFARYVAVISSFVYTDLAFRTYV